MSGSEQPFSYSYRSDATASEIASARKVAHDVARVRGTNRAPEWRLNDCEESPGPCIALRLRDGRFVECEDGPEALGLGWKKSGHPMDIVEYLPEALS